jgi:hypothetical protein
VQQVSYGPLIMSCYTGFINVRRGWQSLNTGPRFYLRLIRRTGWLWISTSRTTDGHPFKPKKLSVPFLYPGVVCFVDRCLSFCTFSFGHCVVCPSSIYGFWLPLWYLQTLLGRVQLSTGKYNCELWWWHPVRNISLSNPYT